MKKLHGFSLIELLVVITIVSTLATISVPIYNKRIVKAKVAANLVPIIEMYRGRVENEFKQQRTNTCIANSIPKFSAMGMVAGVRGKYFHAEDSLIPEQYRGAMVIQVEAVMKENGKEGIGIVKQGTSPLTLELIVRRNGEVIEWTCGTTANYFSYAPAICKQNSSILLASKVFFSPPGNFGIKSCE